MTTENSFPQTRQDLSNLKSTAVEAAKDLGNTAATHAQRAQGQLKDLSSHAREEGGAQVQQVKVTFADLADQARDLVAARPFASLGTALFVGFLFGLSRRVARA